MPSSLRSEVRAPPLSLTISVEPSEEPVSVDEMLKHSRIDLGDDNALLATQITGARLYVEGHTKRALIDQTWLLKFDRFPLREIIVPLPPLSSVVSVTYIDQNGDVQTWSPTLFQTDLTGTPGRIKPIEGESFPDTQFGTYNTVTVTFVAGYGKAADVPQSFKQAIQMIVEHWYEYRGVVSERRLHDVPVAVDALLYQDRGIWGF